MITLLFAGCKKDDDEPKEWNTSLGIASFATDRTWIILGNGIKQIWSDAVQTDYCSNKTSFKGLDWDTTLDWDTVNWHNLNYNVDCRSNPNQKGDLFSWRAVSELKNELCPAPWRVPTSRDFINLDIAMGGTGTNRMGSEYDQFMRDTYLNPDVWGGERGGIIAFFSDQEWKMVNQGRSGAYWTQTEWGTSNLGPTAHFLSLIFGNPSNSIWIYPSTHTSISNGHSLRCIRDK